MTEISETARRVAAQRLAFERVAAPYGDPSADDRLSRDVAGPLPSDGPLREHLEARTRFFDRIVVGCLDEGFTQVVVGAAGYDCRSLRYAKPGVKWFEIDRAATQDDKRERLARLGIECPQVSFIAADFDTDDLCTALTGHGFEDRRRALFLLEGVAVYLERSTLDSVLSQFGRAATSGSRLAISLSVSGGTSQAESTRAAFQAAVARMGEPVRSGVGRDEVDELLLSGGWSRAGERNEGGLVLAERMP